MKGGQLASELGDYPRARGIMSLIDYHQFFWKQNTNLPGRPGPMKALFGSGMGETYHVHSFINLQCPSPNTLPTYSLPTPPLAASYTLDTATPPLARS